MYSTAYRTHTCDDLTDKNVGEVIMLAGFIHRRRDHGGLIFIDLRDRYGLTQVVSDPADGLSAHKTFERVRPEWVIQVKGKVRARPAGQENPRMTTGKIEVLVSEVKILSEAATPPFEIDLDKEVNEEVRMTFRYLDLRRDRMRDNILLRHRVFQATRRFFYDRGFVEIETPILIKGTPEGAREYLVPSRVHAGKFYVLPQSPQQLKQLSMIAGFDRYMQIARCFRDEDQRGDRQPEFTQMDLEMSFVNAEDVMSLNEEALKTIVREVRPDVNFPEKFPRLTYDEAMNRFGSDKPDLRYELEFTDVTEECRGCGFGVFAGVVEKGGVVKVLNVSGGATLTRKDIEELTETAKIYGAKGLAWIRVCHPESVAMDEGSRQRQRDSSSLSAPQNDTYSFEGVPVVKLGEDLTKKIAEKAGTKSGDLLLFAADTWSTACTSLGAVRCEVARKLKLLDGKEKEFAFCWITDFPMFERDKETGEVNAMHHPFTRPINPRDISGVNADPLLAKAEAYDIVLNGYEVGGGSIRIHEQDLQKKIFDTLKITDADAERRFGHMLRAFSYGAPPHGGIAWGLDRLVMILADEPNIREVIAYPKTNHAEDLMLGAPDVVPEKQLKELNIKVTVKDPDKK